MWIIAFPLICVMQHYTTINGKYITAYDSYRIATITQ